jgi:NADH-quinone oxidoreductase subunit J
VLLGIAGIYFMLNFYFLGAVQMTVYAGGVIILYINSIMLVEKIGEPMDAPKLLHQLIAGGISALGIGAGVFAFSNYSFTIAAEESTTTINDVGTAMLSYGENGFILPFEVVSMLLLAVMVGAIVIAKSYHQKENTK